MNLKLALFNFQKELTVEQLHESRIVNLHLANFDALSEKELYVSLRENLTPYTFDKGVVSLLESVKEEVTSKPLLYDLKDLYKKLERQNQGLLYRQPMITLLEIINRDSDDSRMEGILNDLSIYDWIPEISQFVNQLGNNPSVISSGTGNGKAQPVYTMVERVQEGTLTFIGNRWFIINENEIKQTLVENHFKEEEKIREIRILEQALEQSIITDEKIEMCIDEYLTIGIATKDGSLYLNEEKLDSESTLESIFNSPIIPYLKKDQYILCETIKNNVKKFVEMDVVVRVFNPLNPYLESYCFNYKDKMYLYSRDTRKGSSFFQYENASELIHDVQRDMDCDLTKFFENKLSKELKELRQLEDQEQVINMKLKDITESIEMMSEQKALINESKDLQTAFNGLLTQKHQLLKQLSVIKEQKIQTRRQIVG
jgi:hypothetical protein